MYRQQQSSLSSSSKNSFQVRSCQVSNGVFVPGPGGHILKAHESTVLQCMNFTMKQTLGTSSYLQHLMQIPQHYLLPPFSVSFLSSSCWVEDAEDAANTRDRPQLLECTTSINPSKIILPSSSCIFSLLKQNQPLSFFESVFKIVFSIQLIVLKLILHLSYSRL